MGEKSFLLLEISFTPLPISSKQDPQTLGLTSYMPYWKRRESIFPTFLKPWNLSEEFEFTSLEI
jgi:hypothetical protein